MESGSKTTLYERGYDGSVSGFDPEPGLGTGFCAHLYPEVCDPKDPWAVKKEISLEDAIAANISRAEKKKKCRVVCRTHGVGSAHHARSDGVDVSVPTAAPQGLAILLTDAATQTEGSKGEVAPSMQEDIQCAGSDTRPPMLDRTDFESWQQRIRLYCLGKDNGENIMKSIKEGPFQMGTVSDVITGGTEGAVQQGPVRARVLNDLSFSEEKRKAYGSGTWGKLLVQCRGDYNANITEDSSTKSYAQENGELWKPTRIHVVQREESSVRKEALSPSAECMNRVLQRRFSKLRQTWTPPNLGNEIPKFNSLFSECKALQGLGHNLFSVGQFCDSDLEVAFRKHTCFVRDIKGTDVLKGSRGTNLYTISIDEMMKSSR
ncbi:hypothetical protein Tco_0212456 [Tanacetum coccineum]